MNAGAPCGLNPEIEDQLERSSWIRRMFEAGSELRRRAGANAVMDFSLGNPDVPPPAEAAAVLERLAATLQRPGALGYVPNAGLPSLRAKLARRLAPEQKVCVEAGQVMVTCGAAGALCALFRALLSPGDRVVTPAPYFPEYAFYAAHFGAVLSAVPACGPDFCLDPASLERAIDERTRIVLVNSPNNPTGAVYGEASLTDLAGRIERINRRRIRPLFLVSDEPYRNLVYDGVTVPPILSLTAFAAVAGSFSKSLSLAGERIGYLAVNPAMPGVARLVDALVLNNRTLGYVNAPVIGQHLVEALLDHPLDLRPYAERRAAMMAALHAAGLRCATPRGAFYVFPEAPGGDDLGFTQSLLERHILAVPGRGFGTPGYFRLSYAVGPEIIRSATAGLKAAADHARSGNDETSRRPAPTAPAETS